jgi:hypothetical protein
MNQIVPYPLWLGHASEGRDFRAIFDADIRALVQIAAEEKPPQPPRELICCHFPLTSGSGNNSTVLGLAIRTVSALLKMQAPTLVSSGAGACRAPAVAAAALALLTGESIERCLERVVEHHPSDVSPGFWSEVAGILPTLM